MGKTGRPKKTTAPIPPVGSRLTPLKCLGIIAANEGSGGYQVWRCRCSCGAIHIALRNRIQNGTTKSCGCLRREMAQARVKKARQAYSDQCKARREEHAATT